MSPVPIVVVLEIGQLALEISLVPEKRFVEAFATNSADESFDERMRERDIRNSFDLGDLQYTEIGSPTMEREKGIVIGAEVFWVWLSPNGLDEHPTQHDTVKGSGMDGEADDPARVLIHNAENPVSAKRGGLAAKQIDAPETVLHLSNERQPGRSVAMGRRPIVASQNTADDIFIDGDSKRERNLLGDFRAAPTRIALFHRDDGVDQFPGQALGPGFGSVFRCEKESILLLDE